MFRFRPAALLTIALLTATPPAIATAAEFSDAQKAEIGQIVHDYLIKNPEVLREAFTELQAREKAQQEADAQAKLKDNADALYRAEGDLSVGNPKASVTLVEFFDYNCGYCKKAFPDIVKLTETDKDLRIIFKEFPILGPGSVAAARAALASRKQDKYWEFHQAMMRFQGQKDETAVMAIAKRTGLDTDKLATDMKDPAVDAVLSKNLQLGQALGIEGTPGFILGDQLVPGAVGYEALAGAIGDLRQAGGCKIC